MCASKKDETSADFKVKAACATLATTAAKPSRFWGLAASMVEGFFKYMANIRHSALAFAAAAALTGCGDTGANEPWDPVEGANRFVFSINRAVDTIALRPVAVFYRDWMPAPGQRGLHNVLDNLGEPVTAINEVVQGTPGRAATTVGRFLINSTIGVVGIFDVASKIGLSKTKEGMGDTIGYYAGVEPENGGFYMVLPVIGPSNARDGVGLAIDASIDPFSIITFGISSTAGWIYSGARYGATAVDMRSRTLFALDDLEKNSVDFYAALKSAYTQQRADFIRQKRDKTGPRAELEQRDKVALLR